MKLMKCLKNGFFIFVILILLAPQSFAGDKYPHPEKYLPSHEDMQANKRLIDDPRSLNEKFHPSKILPPEIWAKLVFDIDEMKALWAEVVGFKAPDVVGKISPEIKPGKYSYKDIAKYPGLKELFPPELQERIQPGQPPHAGNFPEFEIVPTRQYYWSLPIAQRSMANIGKGKLDDQGYFIPESIKDGGFPFPRPSGKFKGQQLMFNYRERSGYWGNDYRMINTMVGIDKKLKIDFECIALVDSLRLSRRSLIEPFGLLDKRAEKNGEFKTSMSYIHKPRDIKGTTILKFYYDDNEKFDQSMMFIPALRRIRKMSATDTQDPMNGQDLTYDDSEGFCQKLTPNRYPYTYEVIGEREYLLPVLYDGVAYIDSTEGYVYKGLKFERRPCYVVKMTQQDSNYVYGTRYFYIDQETFMSRFYIFYDQKDRPYRSTFCPFGFIPEAGMFIGGGTPLLQRDHIDLHSTVVQMFTAPAFWSRDHFSMKNMMRKAK